MVTVLECVIEFILFFIPLCSVLVYYRYINMGPWGVETRLNIFPSKKHFNIIRKKLNH